MLIVQINAVKELLTVIKTLKEISDKLGVSDDMIRLKGVDEQFLVESSKSDFYFTSTQISDCVVVEEGTYFISNQDIKSLVECANQSGLQSIRLQVSDTELVIDGAALGEIKTGVPSNQQPWKRSPLSREDIEWELLLEEEEVIKECLKKIIDFPKDDLIKLQLKKDDCNLYLSAVDNIGNIYISSKIKLTAPAKYDCFFMVNSLLISKALTLGKGEIRLYISKEGDGSINWEKENKILKLDYPEKSSLTFYSNKEQPNTLRMYELNYINQTPAAQLTTQPTDFINIINWQQFNLLSTDNLFLRFNNTDKSLQFSKTIETTKEDSKLSISAHTGKWVNNYYSIEALNRVTKLLNKASLLNLDLIEIEIEEDSNYYILLFRPTEAVDGAFQVGISFSELITE
jgi:hypothetical protein